MIKNMSGILETVDFRADTQICLYDNQVCEDYPPHWHTSFEVIMPVINSYRVQCGEKKYPLREGDILIICPCTIHEIFAPETGERIIFQPGLTRIAMKDLSLLTSMISPALLITPETCPRIYDRIHRLMLEIKEEYFSTSPYGEASIFSKFLEILVTVGRNHKTFVQQDQNRPGSRQKEYMEKFIFITEYINEHFAEHLTLEYAASLAGFSKYHFSRLFKQYTDTSFYRYLNQTRMEHAKNLLLDPRIAVIDVALQSGFSSLSAFLRMFKQMNQCTPTEFRNMYDDRF